MNTASKTAAIALLFAALTGCTPKVKSKQPVQAQAPPVTTGQGTLYPPPLTKPDAKPDTPPPTPPPVTTAQAPPQPEPKPEPPKRSTHKKKPASTAPAPEAQPAQAAPSTPSDQAGTTQQAANGVPSGASPIGTLSSGSESSGAQTRTQTVDLINSTELGLNAIKRPLSASEQETATKIRDFLVKARQSLGVEDLDGAHTLATKAKVLLDELTKQ